jgi:hypothetical protein
MAGFDVNLTITGLQEAQQANLRLIAAMKPGGRLAGAVQYGAIEAHRYAVAISHVWIYRGGGMKASHRIAWNGGLEATISLDPSAVNPRGQRPAVYGYYEHRRGGEHAFYKRTEVERGATIAKNMREYFLKGLP